MAATSTTPYHGLSSHEVAQMLETDSLRGLTTEQAHRLSARFGPNVLPEATGASLLVRILRQFHHPLIYVLLIAGVITALLREYVDSVVIFAVVVVNAIVGFVQESKAESALQGLRAMVRTDARVVREGRELVVESEVLVPGDLILIEAGDKVPADIRLLRHYELRVDESALTGESLSIGKNEAVLSDVTPVADRSNMLYSGTLVTAGSGAGIVVATGADTEMGEIHRLVGDATLLATPLTIKLARFSKLLTVGILGLAAFTFALGLLRQQDAVETFTASIALAVAAIPEGLPAAVTIMLAIGVSRMAKRRAVVRRLPAVETLGSTTAICADKTGTLTRNQMTVRAVWTPSEAVQVTGSGYSPDGELLSGGGTPVSIDANLALRWSLLTGAGCNDAVLTHEDHQWGIVGDPTEAAMLVVSAKAGLTAEHVGESLPREDTILFNSERQYMATLHATGSGDHVVLVKGAVERMLELCHDQMYADGSRRPIDRSGVLLAAEQLALQGLRVLATGVRESTDATDFTERALLGTVTLTGLQAMLDPPRTAATSAVTVCHTAGIAVKMITGDHAGTASAIARAVGVLEADEDTAGSVLTGAELTEIAPEDLPDAIERACVFARVTPAQKLQLVEAMQEKGHIVAMTGDGVNDAPALRRANIGVAMGGSGTEVAKDAADMVLIDDDFATIEAAVEEGRGVFDNLTKFITWTLPTNVGQALVVLTAIALGTALPILPTQILWINMTTAVFLGLTLAFEPKEADVMTRPPRDPNESLLTGALVGRTLLVSALLVAGAWWLFEWELANGASLPEARTAALNVFAVVQAFYLFSCRSLVHSAWRIGLFTNRWLIVGVATQAIAQLAITYVPFMNTIFQTAPLDAGAWLRIFAIAVVVSLAVGVDKSLGARRNLTRASAHRTHLDGTSAAMR